MIKILSFITFIKKNIIKFKFFEFFIYCEKGSDLFIQQKCGFQNLSIKFFFPLKYMKE